MLLKERLKLALSHDGKKRTQAGLARACGIKPPSVSDWFTGKSATIEGENLVLAAAYLGVKPRWLAMESGPMVGEERSPADEQFAKMPDRLKAVTLSIAAAFRLIPDDQWGEVAMDIAVLLQKDRRHQ